MRTAWLVTVVIASLSVQCPAQYFPNPTLNLVRTPAQDFSVHRTPGALSMGSSLGFAAAFPVVKGAPYTADVLTQQWQAQQWQAGPDGRTVLREGFNIHTRDAAGRVRDEQLAAPRDENGGSTQSAVQVIDPISMQDTQWNNDTKTVFTSPIPPNLSSYHGDAIGFCGRQAATNPSSAQSTNAGPSAPAYENLGTKMIEGVRVTGCRITRTQPSRLGATRPITSTAEIWVSPELQIVVLDTVRYSDGSGRLTRLTHIRQADPAPALFEPPGGYTKPGESRSEVDNSNPNYAKIREYGYIEWHGRTAQLIAGGSRPLDMAARTLSSCLNISVSAEDPHYNWAGDLLDVTAPQWAAQHPDQHAYAAKPGKVALAFGVGDDGQPVDTAKLLEDAADQVNQQQPWHFRLQHDVRQGRNFFTFVPTVSHNESGQLEAVNSWLDDRITILSTAPVMMIANKLSETLTSDTGYHFSCCQAVVAGQFWGSRTVHYEATGQTARLILEDLLIAAGGATSFVQRCEPMDKRFCFINVEPTINRVPAAAPQSGVCGALGYDAN